MEEKRRFPRLNIEVDIQWEKISGQEAGRNIEDPSKTRNISEGGICLISYKRVAAGDRLRLRIILPNNKIISAVGRVCWTKDFSVGPGTGYDVGIEFVEISPQDQAEIKNFVFTFIKNLEIEA